MSEKQSGGDFRYAVGESKVPWHAVGEFYNGLDAVEIVKFLIPDSGNPEYAGKLEKVTETVRALAETGGKATKLTLGKKVSEAEELAKNYFGSKYACFLDNWTGGMEIAYKLAGIGPGDEVIMPAVTFIATMAYPLSVGAKIVFADIDPDTFNIDPAKIEAAITPKTKAIIPVHLYGQPCDMDPIIDIAKRHNLFVIEDACQAIGAQYTFSNGTTKQAGTMGHIGCTSFFPSKNLGCYGDGGAIFVDDDELAATVRALANYGSQKKYVFKYTGRNSRLDEIQAAIMEAYNEIPDGSVANKGTLMKNLMPKVKGKADGKRVAELADAFLKSL